jgi:acetolactate synthase regulatory subunit
MNTPHQFTIESVTSPTVLPRIALMFTRRGVTIDHLEMTTHEDGSYTRLGLRAQCDASIAAKLESQLRRVVEVYEVKVGASPSLAAAATA